VSSRYPIVRALIPHMGEPIKEQSQLWHHWRAAAAESLYFFSSVIGAHEIPLAENVMTYRTHGPICTLLEHQELTHILIEYPRKHLKSTIASRDYPIWCLLKKIVSGVDPYDCNAIISGTARLAERHWLDIKSMVENESNFLRFLFPELEPHESKGWNKSIGFIHRAWDRKDPTFEALSKKSAGKHFDRIIADDLIDEENYDSEDAVENAVILFRMANNLLEKSTDQLIVVGNRWTMRDLNTHIHEEAEQAGWTILSVDAETGPNLSGSWCCYNLPADVHVELQDLAKLAESCGAIWPERIDRTYLNKLRAQLKPAIYAAHYRNRPEDPDAVDFDASLIKSCRIVHIEGEPALQFFPENEILPFSALNIYITWDPALDGKSSRSENAIAVTFTAPPRASARSSQRMRVGIIKEHCRKESPRLSQKKFMAFIRTYNRWLHSSGMEEVLFQRVLKDLIRDDAESYRLFTGLRKIKTPTNQSKDQRIRAWLGHFIEQGDFYIEEGCPRALEQVRYFGVEGMPRDLIDAIAYGTQLWVQPPNAEEEELDWEMDQAIIHEAGVTGYGETLQI